MMENDDMQKIKKYILDNVHLITYVQSAHGPHSADYVQIIIGKIKFIRVGFNAFLNSKSISFGYGRLLEEYIRSVKEAYEFSNVIKELDI